MIEVTNKLLSEWFKIANERYFNNEIKREPKYLVSEIIGKYGIFKSSTWEINISTAYVRSENAYKNTFLHELCHLYVRQKYGKYVQSHGCEWKCVADKITKLTNGKYGVIKSVGGYDDKNIILRHEIINLVKVPLLTQSK